ncbi:hypothetical protein [Dactylosporangium sp. CA-139066]|uniref:hypothetical protein n=1 Tax=Dactylosporangium sp. CA-139066 TaxID=3239930 RepID=UPI003D8F4D36
MIGRAVRGWWAWTARPASLASMWRLSGVDADRAPERFPWLITAWRWSNRTDRLIMFMLVLVAPTGAQGPLRWMLQRPTRRWGFYLVALVLAAVMAGR